MSPCPLGPADRRLRDAFEIWRKIEAAYFEPDEFRRQLNSFFQEARNVTFVLQNNKKLIPRFAEWYVPWQERFRADPMMQWSVAARNRITKQGDLDTQSLSVVTFFTDWTDDLTRRFTAPPAVPSTTVLRQVLQKIPQERVSEESVVCIERRWQDSQLPDHEMLDATAYVLRQLFELLEDAHNFVAQDQSAKPCDQFQKLQALRQSSAIDLANADDSRKIWTRATNLSRIKYSLTQQALFDRNSLDDTQHLLEAHYGPAPALSELGESKTLDDAVAAQLKVAKWLLAKDKKLIPTMLVKPVGNQQMIVLQVLMEDRAGKHIAIRRVASFLSRQDIEWVILVNEVWLASFDPRNPPPARHAIDFPDRREAIAVNGVGADGSFSNWTAEFTRRGDAIEFGDDRPDHHPTNILLPILRSIANADE